MSSSGVGARKVSRLATTFSRLTEYTLHKILNREFIFRGQHYRYFVHPYNMTWMHERAVEIPIVWDVVQKCRGQSILEVGNVLSHYFPVTHDVVDRYEFAPGVINEDVVNFAPPEGYNLIIRISTLEHVGWDEDPRDDTKVLKAIENLKSCMTQQGRFLVTLPIGYNPVLDRFLHAEIRFEKVAYLRRLGELEWVEADWEDVRNVRYGCPLPFANAIVIGEVM